MAVLLDRCFFDALGTMEAVPELSNADIAWFIVDYDESGGEAVLVSYDLCFTTLERAVEGLTAGVPVSLSKFEGRIREKLRNGEVIHRAIRDPD